MRAKWPDHFLSILSGTVDRLIQERWPGLKARFSVPCPGQADGEPCPNRFLVARLYDFQEKLSAIPCTDCGETWEIGELLRGFSPVSAQEQKLDRVLEGVEHLSERVKEGFEALLSQQAAHYQAFLRSVSAENLGSTRTWQSRSLRRSKR